jgi:hypothetical protein
MRNTTFFTSVRAIVKLFATVILIALPGMIGTVSAAAWHVSIDGSDSHGGTSWTDAFATIQKGIDAASNGDTVWVADGTYTGEGNKNINLYYKIEVRSVNGPNSCIIDLEHDGKGFYLFGPPIGSVIDGFTIMNGHPASDLDYGVGVECYSCFTTISNCIIKNNSGVQWGAGIDIRGAHPVIVNSVFSGNHTTTGGSAVSVYQTSATFINCTFSGNTGRGSSVIAGTLSTSITNSIVWNNNPGTISGTIGGIPNVTYSNVEGGYMGDGNIDSDPLFINTPDLWDRTIAAGTATSIEVSDSTLYAIDNTIEINDDGVVRTVTSASGTTVAFAPALGSFSTAGMLIENWGTGATDVDEDFHLYSGSPCIDTGSNSVAGIPDKDIDGKPRFIDGDGDEYMTVQVDMGAYEHGDICEYDFLKDLDTDGGDLTGYLSDPEGLDLSILAEDFGRDNCPNYEFTP